MRLNDWPQCTKWTFSVHALATSQCPTTCRSETTIYRLLCVQSTDNFDYNVCYVIRTFIIASTITIDVTETCEKPCHFFVPLRAVFNVILFHWIWVCICFVLPAKSDFVVKLFLNIFVVLFLGISWFVSRPSRSAIEIQNELFHRRSTKRLKDFNQNLFRNLN